MTCLSLNIVLSCLYCTNRRHWAIIYKRADPPTQIFILYLQGGTLGMLGWVIVIDKVNIKG